MKHRPGLKKTFASLFGEERGANLVEFGFSAIFLLLFVAGIVDFGGALQNYIILENAAREGARTASRLPCTSSNRASYRAAVVAAAVGEASLSNVTLASSNVTYSPNLASTCPSAGSPVSVSVSHGYDTIFGSVIGVELLNLQANVQMLFSGNDVSGWPAIASANVVRDGSAQGESEPW